MPLGTRRDDRHPDRRDVATRHPGEENHDWPAGYLDMIQDIRNWTQRSNRGLNWRADTFVCTPWQSHELARERRQRVRALVFTDSGNTGPVWVAAGGINGDPLGVSHSNAIPLAAGSAQLELTHGGAIHVYATTAAVVYIVEEFYQS